MDQHNKFIVVGASGYIGRQLYDRCSRLGRCEGTSTTGRTPLLALDLSDPENFDFSMIEPNDTVMLTAAISAPDVCALEHDRAWATNVSGTAVFIERAMARGARVIFFSSDAVYGERENEFDESASTSPSGEYANMKHAIELKFGDQALFKSIRLSYVFSREDKFTKYLVGCDERQERASLFHPFRRAVIHRDDVIDGALALAVKWDSVSENVINFGGPEIVSRIEFAEAIRDNHLGGLRYEVTEPDPSFFENRPRVIAMKSPVLLKLLGRPARDLADAVREEF